MLRIGDMQRGRSGVARRPAAATGAGVTLNRGLLLAALASLVAFLTLSVPSVAHAETCTPYTWVGPYGNEIGKDAETERWDDAKNWRPVGIPGAASNCDSVTIKPSGLEAYPVVLAAPANIQLENLTLENATSLASCPESTQENCGGGLIVHGNLVWTSSENSSVDVPVRVEGESTLAGVGEGQLELEEGTTLTLERPAAVGGNVLIEGGGVPAIANNSTLTLAPGAHLEATYSDGGEFGTVRVLLENRGTLALPSGTANIIGELDLAGTTSVGNGATLALGGVEKLRPEDSFTGPGEVRLGTGLSNFNRWILGERVTIGAGTTLEIPEGGGGVGAILEGTGSFIGGGNISWTGSTPIEGTLSIGPAITTSISGEGKAVSGTLSLAGPTSVSADLGGAGAAINNTGALTLLSGSLVQGEPFQQTSGSTLLEGGELYSNQPIAISAGTLAGHGTIEGGGGLSNTGGTVRPSTQGGVLEVTGPYTQTSGGTLETDIEGTTPGSGFGQLQVGQEASLAGTIKVHTQNGFTPSVGQAIRAVTYGSKTGQFGTLMGAPAYHMRYEPAGADIVFGLLPTITKVKPNKGPASGGTSVTITGTNFTGATAVRFGSLNAASFIVNSATSITAVTPSAPAGKVDVTVTTAAGTSVPVKTDLYQFLPTITNLSVSGGSKAGGTSVTVTGSGFALGATASVFKFGTAKSRSVNCTSTTQCTVVAPAHAVGTIDITVTVNKSKSALTSADRFTYS